MSLLLISFLQFADYQDSDARLKVNTSANKFDATSVIIPIEGFVKGFRLVLPFEDDFEYGDTSK